VEQRGLDRVSWRRRWWCELEKVKIINCTYQLPETGPQSSPR